MLLTTCRSDRKALCLWKYNMLSQEPLGQIIGLFVLILTYFPYLIQNIENIYQIWNLKNCLKIWRWLLSSTSLYKGIREALNMKFMQVLKRCRVRGKCEFEAAIKCRLPEWQCLSRALHGKNTTNKCTTLIFEYPTCWLCLMLGARSIGIRKPLGYPLSSDNRKSANFWG